MFIWLKGVGWDSQFGLKYRLERNSTKSLEVNTTQTIHMLAYNIYFPQKITKKVWLDNFDKAYGNGKHIYF
jgi:hypothetical protein